jgi:hypothetical protein
MSVAIAGWVAHGAFWVLLALGAAYGDIGKRSGGVFLALWLAGFLAFNAMSCGAFFLSFTAVLDIVLVFIVFKGDVRLN